MSPFIRGMAGFAVFAALICSAACVGVRKTAEQRADDRALSDNVQAALNADQMLYSRHITIRADNGVVTLTGYAWTPEELQAATMDAQQVSGVTRVINNIEVDRGAIQNSSTTR